MNRINYESECMDEMYGSDKTTNRWLAGCDIGNPSCMCMYCRESGDYFNRVGFEDMIKRKYNTRERG